LSKEGFACPCHGSQFYADGGLRKGPAAKPMRVLSLEIDKNSHLILDTSEE
jgi:cytochrome b6-f complex iron-sulfur subunit